LNTVKSEGCRAEVKRRRANVTVRSELRLGRPDKAATKEKCNSSASTFFIAS
jgi:hypothetical protein